MAFTEFCPQCGTLLSTSREEGELFLYCKRCRFKMSKRIEPLRQVSKEKERPIEAISIVDIDAQKLRAMPTTDAECPNCSFNEAYWWESQAREEEESGTLFFRCKRCGHVWREKM
ncbi:MAG: transcription factor S [Candidatus Bathyarchaeia archaeon]